MNPDSTISLALKNLKQIQHIDPTDLQSLRDAPSYGSIPGCTILVKRGRSLVASDYIAPGKADNLHQAAFHAMAAGVPLNRFVTIHWQLGRLTAGFQDATARFLKLASDWLRLHGRRTAYVWVREKGVGVGEHVHILLSVPPELARAFANRQQGWLKACGVKGRRKGVIRSKPVGRTNRHAFMGVQGGECYAGHLARLLSYILKTAEPETRRRLGIVPAAPASRMLGKRSGTSQNLGRAARMRAASSGHVEPARNCSRKHCLRWFELRLSRDIRCREHLFGECKLQDDGTEAVPSVME